MSNRTWLDKVRRGWTNPIPMDFRPTVLRIFLRVIGYRMSFFIAYIPVYPYKAKSKKGWTVGRMPASAGLSYLRPTQNQVGRGAMVGRNDTKSGKQYSSLQKMEIIDRKVG